MKKYNLSNIMKKAWDMFKHSRIATFAQCLAYSWTLAKQEAVEKAAGIVEMHYSEYKRNYANCKTVANSYNKSTKTIKVYTRKFKRVMGLCPRCHTYCYGDCTAR